jgi:thiamine transport system ATP-binding protein
LTLDAVRLVQGGFSLTADFTLQTGRRAAVIGPSGAGKSTLLGAIGGFLPLAAGRILWHAHDISPLRPGARPVAMLFQDNNLFPHLTVAQNVGLGADARLRLDTGARDRVARSIERVGLAAYADRRPAELSGGQQSRAALARVLVQSRPLLLLDEPFAALGPAMRREMLDLVAELVREAGATLMMVTHAPEDVARLAQDVIFVEGGAAAAPQDAQALLRDPPPALKAYL